MKRIIIILILIITLSCTCVGCNPNFSGYEIETMTAELITGTVSETESEETTEEVTEPEKEDEPVIMQAEKTAKDGALHMRYFYSPDIISYNAKFYMKKSWEDNEFTDVSDVKLNMNDEHFLDFCVEHNGKLINFGGAIKTEPVGDWGLSTSWSTAIYEVNPETGEKESKDVFAGGIYSATGSYGAVKLNDILVMAGPKKITENDDGSISCDASVYCIDLDDYTFGEIVLFKNEANPYNNYKVYEFDGYVYVIAESNYMKGNNELINIEKWYRIDLTTGSCEVIAEFNNTPVWFLGAIGDDLFYTYYDNVLYTMKIGDAATEQEFITVDMDEVIAFVMNDTIAVMTECDDFGQNGSVTYTWYDMDKNITAQQVYDDWIVFFDVIGEKIMYIKPFSDNELCWVDKIFGE